jgi:hypothetical protein
MSVLGAPAASGPAGPRTRVRLGWAAAALGVLAAFVALGLLSEAFTPAPSGPAGSALSSTPAGVAAWAQLLDRGGHPVGTLREPLGTARLAPSATLVVLEAGSLTRAETAHLRAFVSAGGRLVIGGGDPSRTLGGLIGSPPRWISRGPLITAAVGHATEIEGLRQIRAAGRGAWTSAPGAAAVLLAGTRGAALLQTRVIGSGVIDLLADASPVENDLLASADNAQLALNLAGGPGRPVLFAEALHGFGTASGLAAIPTRWWILAIGLALAGGLWALARGRRLGPAGPTAAAAAPTRSAYVDALASALVRARDPQALSQLQAASGSILPAPVRGRDEDTL